MRYPILAVAFTLISVIIGSSGCIVTKVHTQPVHGWQAPYQEVWDSVVAYLDKEEEPIIAADMQNGVITTDWVIMEKVFSTKRYRYEIGVANLGDNEVEVVIASPQESYSMGDWEEMLPTERRAQRIFRFIEERLDRPVPETTVIGKVSKRPFNKRQRGIVREEK